MDKLFCPDCGTRIPEGAKFCPKCGKKIDFTTEYDISNQAELAKTVGQIQHGDKAAFARLIDLTSDMVSSNIRRYLSNESNAEDVKQEVYIKVYQNIQTLSDPDKAYGWIKTIAVNAAKDATQTKFAKHEQLVRVREEDDHPENDPMDESDADRLLSSPVEVPEDYIDNRETRRLIREIVGSLPERLLSAVTDFYYNEKSIKDIAAASDRSEAAVKMDLCRARRILKDKFEELATKQGIRLYAIPAGMFFTLVAGVSFAPAMDAKAAGTGSSQPAPAADKAAGKAAGEASDQVTSHAADQVGRNAAQKAVSDGVKQAGKKTAEHAAGKVVGQTVGEAAGTAIAGGAKAAGGFAALSTGVKAAVFAGVFAAAVGGTVGTATAVRHVQLVQQEQQEKEKSSSEEKNEKSSKHEDSSDEKNTSSESSTSSNGAVASEKAAEVDPAVWRKAYLDEIHQQLNGFPEDEKKGINTSFLYLNDDDIPEIIIYYPVYADGGQLLTYNSESNSVEVENFEGSHHVEYMPDEGKIRVWGNHQVFFSDTVYSVNNQKWNRQFVGNFYVLDPLNVNDNDLALYDSQGRIENPQYYGFYIGDSQEQVTYDKYYEDMFKVYDPTKAVDLTDDQSRWCTADECVSYLETGQPSASGNGMPRK